MDERMNAPLNFDKNSGPPSTRSSREDQNKRMQSPSDNRYSESTSGVMDMEMVDSAVGERSTGNGGSSGVPMNMGGGRVGPGIMGSNMGMMNSGSNMAMNSLPNMGMMNSGPNMGMMNNGSNMMGMMNSGPNMGMMNNGPHMGMMNNAPNMGMVNNAPNMGMLNSGPNMGMMNNAQNMGMMNSGPNMGMMGNMPMNMPGFPGDVEFMMGDPSMMGRPLEVDGKEILHFKGFVLVPPPPSSAPRSTREKPPGCRTLFIGGLPETVTEDMIGELMQTCGNIETIRQGKKFFAHVRFDSYDAVDKGIFYSGWRMKIGDKDDKPNTGRIHCDYATARDDQYEYECMQRTMEREQRHHRRMIADMNRPPSPPQVARYSESEANNVTELLKSSQGFAEAANMLTEWMDKGHVSTRNGNRFYSMLHCVNSTVRRLTGEKEQFEQELVNYKAQYRTKVTGLLTQMEQIQNVFVKARQQRVWDHFSKPQRKNVELWTKQCQELKQKHSDEFLANREEDEMDLSDTEDGTPASKKSRIDNREVNGLKDENDSLKCQLEGYKNELDMSKQEGRTEVELKNKQITMLQQTLKGMQEQLMSTRNEVTQLQRKFDESKESKESPDEEENKVSKESSCTDVEAQASTSTDEPIIISAKSVPSETASTINEGDARLLGLIVCFLHVHPFGASMDYIWSYLQRGGLTTRSSTLETLLESYPTMFEQKIVGVGVNLEKRWTFVGFPAGSSG